MLTLMEQLSDEQLLASAGSREFAAFYRRHAEAVLAYFDSTAVQSRWVEYKQLWGADRAIRRRAFAPIFERRSEPR